MIFVVTDLAIHMSTNANLVSASSGLFYLLAILAGSDIASEKSFLLLNLTHLPISG
jgi:hypothetical protein